jgi:hypothetical protein
MTFDRNRFGQEVNAATSRGEITRAWSKHFHTIIRLPRPEQLALYAIAEARADLLPPSSR